MPMLISVQNISTHADIFIRAHVLTGRLEHTSNNPSTDGVLLPSTCEVSIVNGASLVAQMEIAIYSVSQVS